MEDETDEEKLLANYLDSHPEFLEKWLKQKDQGDVYLRNLICAFQNQKNNTNTNTNTNTNITNTNNSLKEPSSDQVDKEISLNNNGQGDNDGASGQGVGGELSESQQQQLNTRKASTASTVGGHHHIRSKRNSISSDRFHTWLSSSTSSTSNSGGGNNVKNNEVESGGGANNNNSSSSGSNSNNYNDNNSGNNFNRRESTSKQLVVGGGGIASQNNKLLPTQNVDQNELFIELVKDISNELNIDCLCHKILVNVSYLTQADRCSLFLARGPQEQRYLVAKLFDVTVDSGPEEALERARAEEIRIPFGIGIVGNVAQTKEVVNIKDAYQDPRFNYEVDCRTGYTTHSVLALPICNNEDDIIGVAQVINKKSGDSSFSSQDVEVIGRYLTFCGISIQNAQLFETSVAEYRKNQLLLNLARSIFEEQTGLERLVSKIMKEAQELLQCERSLVYLRDVPLYEADHAIKSQIESILLPLTATSGETARSRGTERKLLTRRESKTVTVREVLRDKGFPFDFIFELNTEDSEVKKVGASLWEKSPLTRIAQYVARNSEILNIGDAVTWYGQSGTEGGELVASCVSNLPRSILCMPIYNGQRQVIGVAQLINKANNQPFTDSDAMTFEAFAIFCGLGIHNTQLYESACKLMAKQSVALECLSYHATASFEDTERLRKDDIPSCSHFKLFSYAFSDFGLTDSETCQATVRMFCELNLVEKFHIPYAVLCRWVLSVKKNYRPVKYHNWRHAFNVAQTMFTVLKTGKMEQFLDDLDILGLMVACLCHDLDHRGTNNAFQQLTASPLAVLYSTSTMEHHHFDQCVMILSSEGNNIFQDVTAECYRRVMKIVEKSILSTDLAMYFRKKDKFIELIDNGEISWQGEDKKDLLCGMMMTACDVAAISKPWELQHKIAKLVADEFFDQGDLEKEQLNQQPVAMMDREKKDELPKMQLSFIDVICLPLYKTLSEVFPWLQPLLDGCKANRKNWQDLAEKVDMGLTWIDHDFIEKPVEEFTGTDTVLDDVNFVVTTLNCGANFEVLDQRGKGHKFKVGRWFRGGKKNSSADSTTTTTTSSIVQSPIRNDNPNRFDGILTEQTNLVIMEEVGGGGGTTGGVGDKFSPKKSCLIS